jgi:hypothetical protein
VIQVQCLSLIAKSVGNKLSAYLSEIVPLLQQLMQIIYSSEQSNDIDNDLSEACLTTLQSIIHKCPS